MTYLGHVIGGKIALNEPVKLPEGALVRIELLENAGGKTVSGDANTKARRRDGFEPMIMKGGPLSEDISRDRR